MGRVRYLVAGFLLVSAAGVVVKVALVAALDVRYLWVTPWFRI
jgi:TolB-like protein